MKDIKIFESKKIRSNWDNKEEKWFFSIVDIIEVLTDSPRPRKYWSALKAKLKSEGSELSQNLGQLKISPIMDNVFVEKHIPPYFQTQ